MKHGVMNSSARDIQTLFEVGSLAGVSDGQLLDRFLARREIPVFEAIVLRHAPMVWGVCHRVLRSQHDAEDAFQTTFLVLARKASSIKAREKLGNWLHGVAYQTAMKARATKAKRRRREVQLADIEEIGEVDRDERLPELDRELSRLPEKYRVPIVLCELEGKSHKEAAELLGWPVGTVSGRLSRGKAMLAGRLSRGEATHSAGWLSVLLAKDSASARMTLTMTKRTAQAATMLAAGRAVAVGVVSAEVMTLMEGVLKTMFLSKLKIQTAVIAMGLALAVGGTSFAFRAQSAGRPGSEKVSAPIEMLVARAAGTQAEVNQPQDVPKKAQDQPIDPMASYPFKLDPGVYQLPELVIDYRNFQIKSGQVSVQPISYEAGVTGAMIIGSGTFRYTPEDGVVIEGQFRAAMLRFNPEEWAKIIPVQKWKPDNDRGVTEMSRQMLQVAIRHCWQSNKQGGRIQEVLIPPKGAFAAVLYSREHGDLLISFDDRTASAYNFTDKKSIYQKK